MSLILHFFWPADRIGMHAKRGLVLCLYSSMLATQLKCMRKHFHLIGHFFKNAQSSDNWQNVWKFFWPPQKCPIKWECLHIPKYKHSHLIGFGNIPNQLSMLAHRYMQAFSLDWVFLESKVFQSYQIYAQLFPINWECLFIPLIKHSQLIR